MELDARCKTTAMGIMPHTDVDRALELVLALDIPFFPQLPKVSFYEDMYVQASENFPGIIVDTYSEKLSLNTTKFAEELEAYSQKMGEPDTFALSEQYSLVYHRFLERSLGSYPAIRGQLTGPVSFGFKVVDEDKRPIIYNDDIRTMLFDFIQRKVNHQYRELKEKNRNAFVWLDEPGLGWVFSGLSGYNDMQAKQDYHNFLNGLEGPRALHLCANINLPYLLSLGIEVLSFDSYQIEIMPKDYAVSVARFLEAGGIISWGIVPIDSLSLSTETPATLAGILSGYWEVISRNSRVSTKQVAEQALIAPARCCLKDVGQVGAPGEKETSRAGEKGKATSTEEGLVEKAFDFLPEISQILREKYGL
jgi:hypothetical protein